MLEKLLSLPLQRRRLLVLAFALVTAFAGVWTLPPLDRDEARFAQATAQMLETGDFVNIRFQDAARNKKPVGIHWMQAASVSAFSSVEAREIWAYRLPSALGVVLAVMLTYAAGRRLYGEEVGLLAALLLAAAPVAIGEAAIAKTDAMLLACVCAAQTALIHLYAATVHGNRDHLRGWRWSVLFWIGLGVGILIKGPIAPMVSFLTIAALSARERSLAWTRVLRPIIGAAILAFVVAPWAILIGLETGGAFFTDAIGGDMLGKVGAGQESHAAPPGVHLLLTPLLFWPAAGLMITGLFHSWRTRRAWPSFFLLAWLAPSWIVFELSITKLPHYTLPLYPALAIMAARGAVALQHKYGALRKIGAALYLAIGGLAAGIVAALPFLYAEGPSFVSLIGAAAIFALAALAALHLWRAAPVISAVIAASPGSLLGLILLTATLPGLDALQVSRNLSHALEAAERHPRAQGAQPVALVGYHEPSAVFLLGTQTVLTDAAGAADHLAAAQDHAAFVEQRREDAFLAAAAENEFAVEAVAVVTGLNYSKGDKVTLTLYANTIP